MAQKEIILSAEGLSSLEEELEYLRTVRRREVAERIKQAREFGDISENSEYADAKEEQAFIEGRIAHLQNMLRNARVINESDLLTDVVGIGSKVRLRDEETGDELEYVIVSSTEADPAKGKISNEAPVGRAVLGHKAGDTVEVAAPVGVLKYTILGVGR